MNKRKSLGRGLDALLSSARPARRRAAPRRPRSRRGSPPAEATLREVPVDLLQRGRYQPRVDMRDDSLAELAESIKAQGVVQPIVVRPLPTPGDGETRYEIIAGERRWRAAQLAGLHTIPAVIRDVPDEVGRRDRADREHPAREPEPARGSASLSTAHRRVRAHAPARRDGRRPLARRRHEPAAAARAAARGPRVPRGAASSTWGTRARCSGCRTPRCSSRSRSGS